MLGVKSGLNGYPLAESLKTTLAMPYPGFCVSQLYSDIALRLRSELAYVPGLLTHTGNQRILKPVFVREA